ncbi:phosphatase PAP2 family protein [Pontibacter sp. KCTC 32443]|uniref:phosphatase PAP2 family protein n=1 Tax=Pontibacter TaxID=323449 RepID=UPI00164D1C2B|nr:MULTISPECIES: phosphatase PAP2 family protein [Pontibacter]MBC5774627.1 phosphatase PAP2 family protein [Pontibacter sp. KCTC 32443]
MKRPIHFLMTLVLTLMIFGHQLLAQQTDSLKKYETPKPDTTLKVPFYKSKLFKATIVPAILIGYGVSTIRDNGLYSSYDAREDILDNHPNFDTWLDDPLLIAPYVELAIVNLMQVRSNNDLVNTSLVTLKAEAVMAVMVFGLKEVTKLERPNGEDDEAMPSGHTAQAFLAASIVHTELRHHSQWYGVGAYAIATSVGAIRMLKNKHWQSDVFVGAGIGILSAHLSYLSHRNRWGRKPFTLIPTYNQKAAGLALFIDLDQLSHKSRSLAKITPQPAITQHTW